MGTLVTIEALRPDVDDRISRAFEWFRHVEATCTRFDPQSELFQLTTTIGEPASVSTLLFEAIAFAISVAETTGGAFDPTVGARMQQRGFTREHRSRADVPRVEAEDVTYRDVIVDLDARTVTLQRPMLLDLGAVAKGLAIDLAATELQPLQDFAIDAGGDLYMGGRNPDGEPWSVGIRHPREDGGVISRVQVSNQAVCTSGDYERGNHIVRSGQGAARGATVSATVIAPSAMVADALSTAAFVLEPAEAIALLERVGVEGMIIGSDLSQTATTGWTGE